MLLMEIRSKTISYEVWKKRKARDTEVNIEKEIKHLSDRIADSDNSLVDALNEKQLSLVNLRKSKMDGVMVRSRTRWMEYGEKPSKYLLNLEKRNCNNRIISRIIKGDGTDLTTSRDIIKKARFFIRNFIRIQDRGLP